MITQQGFDNQLRTLEQTNVLQNNINNGLANNREQSTSQFNILSAKIDAQTQFINEQFCNLEKREMQNEINSLREQNRHWSCSPLSKLKLKTLLTRFVLARCLAI